MSLPRTYARITQRILRNLSDNVALNSAKPNEQRPSSSQSSGDNTNASIDKRETEARSLVAVQSFTISAFRNIGTLYIERLLLCIHRQWIDHSQYARYSKLLRGRFAKFTFRLLTLPFSLLSSSRNMYLRNEPEESVIVFNANVG